MTTYRIDATDAQVVIDITDVGDRQFELLQAFGECQEGRCSCPTDEYEKVASMVVRPTPDQIDIRLEPKPGMRLDTSEIAACLDYTVERTR